jgi:predicted ATP-binding protein involved in virulence
MRIERIHIKGLFGMFEHDIRLNKEERITVIYGMNGIGKTMIFRILDSLFKRNLFKLSKYPFASAHIYVENNQTIEVSNSGSLNIRLLQDEKVIDNHLLFSNMKDEISRKAFREIERRFPVKRIDEERYMDYRTKDVFELAELLEKYAHEIPTKLAKQLTLEDGNGKIANLLNELNTHFIETQRLIQFSNDGNLNRRLSKRIQASMFDEDEPRIEKMDTVEYYSQELSNLIADKHREYAKLSESFELSLGKRLMDKTVNTYSSREELKQESKQLDEKRENLKTVGLFDDDKDELFIIPDDVNELTLAILSVNVQDMKSKLRIFDDIYYKLSLFLDIINKRRFSYKAVSIHPDKGFIFENINNKKLKVTELSSGEQHELILMYELLFKVPEDSLVLIDEPEISLHVAWQKKFLNDLREIIAIRKFDVMVSTHSPSIINGEWDLAIGLDKEKEEYV